MPIAAAQLKMPNITEWQAERNWAMKYEATIVPDNQGQSCRTQCYQYEQAYHADAQRGVNNYTRPGKMVDSKTMQRTRRPVMNGGSSMRVVFLGANTRRESGTGVFLPRVFVQKKPPSSRQNGECRCCYCTQLLCFSVRSVCSYRIWFKPYHTCVVSSHLRHIDVASVYLFLID